MTTLSRNEKRTIIAILCLVVTAVLAAGVFWAISRVNMHQQEEELNKRSDAALMAYEETWSAAHGVFLPGEKVLLTGIEEAPSLVPYLGTKEFVVNRATVYPGISEMIEAEGFKEILDLAAEPVEVGISEPDSSAQPCLLVVDVTVRNIDARMPSHAAEDSWFNITGEVFPRVPSPLDIPAFSGDGVGSEKKAYSYQLAPGQTTDLRVAYWISNDQDFDHVPIGIGYPFGLNGAPVTVVVDVDASALSG